MKKFSAVIVLALSTIVLSCGGSSSSSDGDSSGSDASAAKSEFCKAFAEFMAAGEKLNENLLTSDSQSEDKEAAKRAIEEVTRLVATLADKMTSSAPDDLKDEAKLVADGMVQTFDLLASIDYDFTKAMNDPEIAQKFDQINDDPDIQAANEAVDAYVTDECGIDFNDSSSSSGDSNEGDFCQTARAYVSAKIMLGMLFDPDSPDSGAVEFAFQSISGQAASMVDAAPDELRDQAQVIADNEAEVLKYLKSVDYDINEVLNNPEFDDLQADPAAQEAIQAIQDSCGISLEG